MHPANIDVREKKNKLPSLQQLLVKKHTHTHVYIYQSSTTMEIWVPHDLG